MITGSCLCGNTRWEIDGVLSAMDHCHCSMCRKAHGAAFGTYAHAKREEFRWTSGESDIKQHESSNGFGRSFCGTCGSVVPGFEYGDHLSVPVGCMDGDPGCRPAAHIFASSAPKWSHVPNDLPHHDAYADPASGPNIPNRDLGPAKPGVLRGSCLCNAVAYEVTTPMKAVHHCHCSRCRKARAAAHTTNGFTEAGGVNFLRGEELLVTYKVPDAKFFSHTFCSRCGSGMPRVDLTRDIAVIPYGSLDDEPDMQPQDHIYVGSKAPWFTPDDGLPTFEERP